MTKKRKYKVTDAVFLEFSGVAIHNLSEDLARFTAYDPNLNTGKLNDLKILYDKAYSSGTDEIESGNIGLLTENMKHNVFNCKSVYKDVRYFARKKFRNNPAVLNRFGVNKFRKARNRKVEFILFMFEVAEVVMACKDDLIAAGMTENAVNNILPAAEELKTSNLELETAKKERSLRAEERINLFNEIYDILLDFSGAAKIIFAGDALLRRKYIIPYKKTGNSRNKSGKTTKRKQVEADYVI